MKNNKVKRILIALDYDPTAQKVAETGYLFAQAMGAEVIRNNIDGKCNGRGFASILHTTVHHPD